MCMQSSLGQWEEQGRADQWAGGLGAHQTLPLLAKSLPSPGLHMLVCKMGMRVLSSMVGDKLRDPCRTPRENEADLTSSPLLLLT